MNHPAIEAGRVAVVTGGASGIGLATAKRLAEAGMRLVLVDRDDAARERARAELAVDEADLVLSGADVSDFAAVEALRDEVLTRFDDVAILMNNAGVGGGGGPWEKLDGWRRVLDVNLWGVVHGMQAFVPAMLERGRPGAVINTGSKQGITNPPGDAAYNASKAAVKSVTESLAHALRQQEACPITAHLLVPGFTYTGMIARFVAEQPPAAWTPDQVAALLLERMAAGDFYVICPDNDVDFATDDARMRWHLDDIIEGRPALSRWHPDHAAAFAAFLAAETGKD
ncbi:MAG: SDR family NAD(P)-dependent oxidoreductase [Pseudomonadales bacterium]|jgi:NAD(P)-dependent dehydrogenase (short-subunit alcohol dehydrogenase family)|nr:SDR family NAD(P)-dependent oxidoreductase [Pseudomonadales bacterium]